MAYYRQIYITYWTDSKVKDTFSPEDKYFYLYLLTNNQTNLCGCYEIGIKQMTEDTGYNVETVNILLDRLQNVHKVIAYSSETKEVLLLNWHRYNWSKSEKLLKGVAKECERIKTPAFKAKLCEILALYGYPIDTLPIPYPNPMDTSVTVTVSNNTLLTTSLETNREVEEVVVDNKPLLRKEIIDYLNEQTGKHFRYNSQATNGFIDARLEEGYTVDDFKTVIDNKTYEWKGTEQEQYLRPETLFRPSHFESYLNQKKVRGRKATGKNEDFWAKAGKGNIVL